jgi:ketosteroid isomerase-like protein
VPGEDDAEPDGADQRRPEVGVGCGNRPADLGLHAVGSVPQYLGGHAFATAAIQVFRIRDGKILLFRDYPDPRELARVLGD